MKRKQMLYGSERIASAWTAWGLERRARRWLQSPINAVRQPGRRNLRVRA